MGRYMMPVLVMLVGVVGGLANFLLEPLLYGVGACQWMKMICFSFFFEGYVEAVALFGVALVLIGFILFFVLARSTRRWWLGFTLVYGVAYLIVVYMTPPVAGLLQAQRDLVALSLSGLYVVLSLTLIAYKAWRGRSSVIRK